MIVEEDGIKLQTEKMMVDKLYHCLYQNRIFLFFKDQEGLLHCYEVQDQSAVEEISNNPTDIEKILKKYCNLPD